MLFRSPAKIFEVAPNYTEVDFGAMYAGAVAINKNRFDKFPEEVKVAFRRAGNAYRGAYLTEQTGRIASSREAWLKGGGKFNKLSSDDQARFVKLIPNPAKEWVKQTEAKGLPARKVLTAYMDAVRATGYKFPRDFDKE